MIDDHAEERGKVLLRTVDFGVGPACASRGVEIGEIELVLVRVERRSDTERAPPLGVRQPEAPVGEDPTEAGVTDRTCPVERPGVLVYGGFERRRALVLNYVTQATVILGGVVGWLLAGRLGGVPVFLLPFAAGNFVYIASADLVPEIKGEGSLRRSLLHFAVFLGGVLSMLGVRLLRPLLG